MAKYWGTLQNSGDEVAKWRETSGELPTEIHLCKACVVRAIKSGLRVSVYGQDQTQSDSNHGPHVYIVGDGEPKGEWELNEDFDMHGVFISRRFYLCCAVCGDELTE